ncbi:MAG: SCO family protein [Caldilineae bacterium]|nr:MAG: SCO family protein [Caldilineae bacterium]
MRMRSLWLVILAAVLAACGTYQYRGTTHPGDPAPDFTLQSTQGGTFRLADQRGKVVLLFFGYTHCPDVCPTTLAAARQVLNGLGDRAAQVRFVFITVDPARDTLAELAAYTAHFHPDIIGLTGDESALQGVYDAYRIVVERETPASGTSEYAVTHTARIYLIDPAGRLRLSYPFGTPWQDVLEDVKHILSSS